MDKSYLSATLAETLGNEYGIVEAEHKLLNDGKLKPGMKRQLQDIHDEDEQHVRNLEMALDIVGRPADADQVIKREKDVCRQMIEMAGDDPIHVLRNTILAKYKSVDEEEVLFDVCDEVGQENVCQLFETNLEEEEDHLDYLREQVMLMTRERITGEIQ